MEKVYNKKHSKPKHSGFGIASFAIFITTVIAHFSIVLIKSFFEMRFSTGTDADAAIIPLYTFMYSILAEPVFAIYLLGFVLGIIGLFHKNRRKVLAVLGIVFNLPAFIVVTGIIILISVSILSIES